MTTSPRILSFVSRNIGTAIAGILASSLAGCVAEADGESELGKSQDEVVYGSDDRLDYREATGAIVDWADPVAIVIRSAGIDCVGNSCVVTPDFPRRTDPNTNQLVTGLCFRREVWAWFRISAGSGESG